LAKLFVPKRHHAGLAVIRSLNDIQASALASELDAAAGAHRNGQSFAANHAVVDLDSAVVAKGFNTLKELYRVREHEHMTVEEFAEEVINAMNDSARADLSVSDEEHRVFKQRLVRLMSVKPFGIEAKATDLGKDFEHLYCQSRVLTDLRPVFGDDVTDGPIQMLITHTVRIGYHDYGDHKEIYVALSDEHVQRLIDQLLRAQNKGRLLSARYSIDKDIKS
jgi:hypothetical protein